MKPRKYIFLSGSSKGENLKYYELESESFFVGSWAGLIARRLKGYKPELDITIWRIEPVVKKPFKKTVFNLDGVIWPYKLVLIRNILSFAMYFKILKLSIKNDIIIHYHSIFDRFILIRYFLPSNVKIVLSHHGGVPPVKNSLKDILFRMTYRHASSITYLNLKTRDYLRSLKVQEKKLHFLPVGADFNFFKPTDRKLAREKLGLDQGTIYGIYVGSFYRLKSVDLILEIYYKLREKYNFSVIFVGGEENDGNDLYHEVVNSCCPFFGRQKWTDMPDFYNAANFYIHPAFNPNFGGIDVAWMEALACNIPVMSPLLKSLDFDYAELGVLIDTKEDALGKIEWMINNYHKLTKCREIAIKHLDGNRSIMEKLVNIYYEI